MADSRIVGGCLGLSILLAGAVSVVTGSSTVLGTTPAGVGIYLTVGIVLPQYLLYRETEAPIRLGLAALAVAAAALVVTVGLVRGTLHADWGPGLAAILLVVVLGNLFGAIVREFRAGYRSGT